MPTNQVNDDNTSKAVHEETRSFLKATARAIQTVRENILLAAININEKKIDDNFRKSLSLISQFVSHKFNYDYIKDEHKWRLNASRISNLSNVLASRTKNEIDNDLVKRLSRQMHVYICEMIISYYGNDTFKADILRRLKKRGIEPTLVNNDAFTKDVDWFQADNDISLKDAVVFQDNKREFDPQLEWTDLSIRHLSSQLSSLGHQVETMQWTVKQKSMESVLLLANTKTTVTGIMDDANKEAKGIVERAATLASKSTDEIRSKLDQADLMIGKATDNALGSAFLRKMEEYEKSARVSFVSYGLSMFLFVIAVISFVGVFLILQHMQIVKLDSITSYIYLVLLLLPVLATYSLVNAFKNRYNTIFRLCQDYTHKYTIAMSLAGYKQHAPEYKEELAASTFFEISFNPADNISAIGDGKESKSRKSFSFHKSLLSKFGISHRGVAEESFAFAKVIAKELLELSNSLGLAPAVVFSTLINSLQSKKDFVETISGGAEEKSNNPNKEGGH